MSFVLVCAALQSANIKAKNLVWSIFTDKYSACFLTNIHFVYSVFFSVSFFMSVFDVSTDLSVYSWEQVACNGCRIMFNTNMGTWKNNVLLLRIFICLVVCLVVNCVLQF